MAEEEGLMAGGSLFDALFNGSPDAIAISKAADGRFSDANEAFCEMVGRPRDQVIGRTATELGLTTEGEREAFVQQLRTSGKAGWTGPFPDGTGKIRHGAFTVQMVTVEGEPSFLTIVKDLSDLHEAKEGLQEQQTHLKMLMDNMPGVMWTTDANLRLMTIQGAGLTRGPFETDDAIGTTLRELLGESAADYSDELDAPLAGRPSFFEVQMSGHNLSVFMRPMTLPDGSTGTLGAAIDVTHNRATEDALRGTASRLEAMRDLYQAILSASSPEVIARYACERMRQLIPCHLANVSVFDRDTGVGRVVAVDSDAPTELRPGFEYPANPTGPAAPEFMRDGMFLNDISPRIGMEPFDTLAGEGIRSVMALPLVVEGQMIGAIAMGSRDEEGFSEEHLDIAREVANPLAIAFNQAGLHERAENYAAELEVRLRQLRLSDAERRHLLAQVVKTQEEERRRIANDIHDDSIQKMAAVGLRLDVIRHGIDDPGVLEQIDQLAEVVGLSIGRLRRLMFELWPPDLERYGLAAAVRADLIAQRDDYEIEFSLRDDMTTKLPLEERIIAYRIVQEALSNVRRHSGASKVDVTFATEGEGVKVVVRDDGRGLPDGTDSSPPGHLGLSAMRERAQLAGGWLRIGSEARGGTKVEFFIPAVETDGPAIEGEADPMAAT